jgi:hypothetical protein
VDGNEVVSVECPGPAKQRLVVVEVHESRFDHVRTYRGQILMLSGQALALEIHNLHKARKSHLAHDLGALDALGDKLQPPLDRLHARERLAPEAVCIRQIRRAMQTHYRMGSGLEHGLLFHHRFAIVIGSFQHDAYAEEDEFAAAVEADYGRLQLRSVQLLGFACGAHEEGCGVQLVQIQGVGQLERLLLEIVVDLILVVVNRDLAWCC